jgi:hypothetical protein
MLSTSRTESKASLHRAELLMRQPTPPVSWLSLSVHDGNDEDVISLNRVEHGVREHPDPAAAHVFLQNPPAVGRSHNFGDRPTNLLCKALAQFASALPIEFGGFLEFRSRPGMKCVPHLPRRRSIRR